MSYELSFAENFFTGEPEIDLGSDDVRNCYSKTKRPTCVLHAIVEQEKLLGQYFRDMVKEVLGLELLENSYVGDNVFFDLLEKARAYNKCDTLTSPIDVFLNENYSVTVYED